MALDPLQLFTEDLYEPTKIYLFGKKFRGLRLALNELRRTPYDATELKENNSPMPPGTLEQEYRRIRYGEELSGNKDDPNAIPSESDILCDQDLEPTLARIYSFSYEGNYYKLDYPLIYMVWGNGIPPEEVDSESGLPKFLTRNTGIEGKDWRFGSDIRVWKIDRHDKSICIDLDIGSFKEILLEPCDEAEIMSARAKMASRAKVASRAKMTSRAKLAARAKMVGAHQE